MASTAAAPLVLPHSVFGANSPSNHITVGVIGLGTRGMPNMNLFLKNDDVQVVAICDVNRASKGYRDENALMGLEPALKLARYYYASRSGSGSFQGVDATHDFREIIRRDDIDAVAIVAPDHWHTVMTIMAAEAGKDIFCQYPMMESRDEYPVPNISHRGTKTRRMGVFENLCAFVSL